MVSCIFCSPSSATAARAPAPVECNDCLVVRLNEDKGRMNANAPFKNLRQGEMVSLSLSRDRIQIETR
jgi:hypothetical protein